MKLKIVVIFLTIILFFQPLTTYGATDSNTNSLKLLNELSIEALQLTTIKRYDDAEKVLVRIKNMLSEPMHEQEIPYEQKRILDIYLTDVMKNFEKEDFTHDQVANSLMTFRLVVDALISTHTPLWSMMEDKLLTSFHTVKEAVVYKNSELNSVLEDFLSLYDMIYPSIMLDVPVSKVQKIDIQIQYIRNHSNELLEMDSVVEVMEALETDLENLFSNTEEDEADPSLWWVIISTGGIIVLTLLYVGFRKYKGEKEKKHKYESEQKN